MVRPSTYSTKEFGTTVLYLLSRLFHFILIFKLVKNWQCVRIGQWLLSYLKQIGASISIEVQLTVVVVIEVKVSVSVFFSYSSTNLTFFEGLATG